MMKDRYVTVHVADELLAAVELLAELGEWSAPVQVQITETPGLGTGYELTARTDDLMADEMAEAVVIAGANVLQMEARVETAETALAAIREQMSVFLLHNDDGRVLLGYEHPDGEVCIVAEVTCGPVLETLEALLDVPDQPNAPPPQTSSQ